MGVWDTISVQTTVKSGLIKSIDEGSMSLEVKWILSHSSGRSKRVLGPAADAQEQKPSLFEQDKESLFEKWRANVK